MVCFRGSKIAHETLRNFTSRFLSKCPKYPSNPSINTSASSLYNHQIKPFGSFGSSLFSRNNVISNGFKQTRSNLCNPNINPNASSLYNHKINPFGSFGSSLFSRNNVFSNGFKQTQSNLRNAGGKRYYYVDRHQIHHFKPRGFKGWLQNPKNMFIIVVVGSGVVITVYYGNLEVVPYTKRKHFVLLSKSLEKHIGESQFKEMKKSFKGKILPAIHPESVRVRLIAKDIIDALQRGFSHETVWSDPGYGTHSGDVYFEHGGGGGGEETLKALSEGGEEKVYDGWRKDEEILDDKWVKESRKKGDKHGVKASTHHLDGLNWEVLVVDEPVVNAFCLPGGKIVVFTGLLKHFRSDAEVATIIGHEVGHAVARHSAEQITKNMWLAILQLVLYQFFMPDVVNAMSNLLLKLPFSRKMEMEADYIGLLLIASAGYDPRVAPQVYEKLGKVTGESALRDYLSTHPSGKKRAQLLAKAQVMEEALSLYREVIAGRGVEGFL